MRGGLVPVVRDAADLGFEQRDPRIQLIERIAVQALGRELAGSSEAGDPYRGILVDRRRPLQCNIGGAMLAVNTSRS